MENNIDMISQKKIYQQARIDHWNRVALKHDHQPGLGNWYHNRLKEVFCFLVAPGQRVLEIGCGEGNLLSFLKPSYGVGIDFSPEMIKRAITRFKQIEFIEADAHDLSYLSGHFDVIIFSDIINDLWDVQDVLEQVKPFCISSTRLIINFYSRLWQIPLSLAQWFKLADPLLDQNWLTREDITGLLNLADFEVIRRSQEIIWPLPLGGVLNRFFVRFWPFTHFALTNVIVARPLPKQVDDHPRVSVIIPARNEAGNIRSIFERMPQMGGGTELIFVEGHSIDNTVNTIKHECAAHPAISSQLLKQIGKGKADAVRMGFSHARGDILIILDADLTVPPEDLPRFYDALISGKGEFINGVRLVYPMEKKAMRALNFLGNKFFSLAFSWLLGQSIKDTLCGTKCLWRKDYEKIATNRAYFGDFDPFGDFDLIFGATKLNLKIIDLPVRYRERIYGSTNISRWKHGFLLLRMVNFAAKRIKFI